jgi:phosphoglycerate kinase
MIKSLKDLPVSGKRIFVRVDFNVPIDNDGQVSNNARILAALPTLNYLLENGGRIVIASHWGRPNGTPNPSMSLKPVIRVLSDLLGRKVAFSPNCIGPEAIELSMNLKNGEVLLLENLRFHKEEEEGNPTFAQSLASLAEIYVNDAFGAAHRAHASTAVMASFFGNNKAPGFLMQAEIESINKVMDNPKKPFVSVVGGAKVSSKMAILENLINLSDTLIVGGGMVFTFVKALGGTVGNSLIEEDMIETAAMLIQKCKQQGKNLCLPVDALCSQYFGQEGELQLFPVNQIPDGWMGLDIGPKTIAKFSEIIASASTLVWNGPMGVFEMPAFEQGTRMVGEAIAKATVNGNCYSLVGGGDSVAAIAQFGLNSSVSYVSTGGGAMLECMEGRILPGMAALSV